MQTPMQLKNIYYRLIYDYTLIALAPANHPESYNLANR